MIEENNILDVNLPLSQNYLELKNNGLSFIQEYGSLNWTNLNQSDPGVTILDQLCYALTELGYCTDFSIEDILTNESGEIDFENQFYLPYDILTTSPITVDDYRKIIIDNFPNVINALVTPKVHVGQFGNSYSVLLYIDPAISDIEIIEGIRKAVFILLNENRNLNEFFEMPNQLEPIPYFLSGTISISTPKDFEKILIAIQEALNEYIFSGVAQHGYDELRSKGIDTDAIVNGPKLVNGWIMSDQLGNLKINISNLEAGQIIANIEGIEAVSNFLFINEQGDELLLSSISVEYNQLIKILIANSFNQGYLKFRCKGVDIDSSMHPNSHIITEKLYRKTGDVNEVSSVELSPELPKGKFRDLADYYSIQNTFPEIYSVGPNAKTAHVSTFEIAQSRQLMGYLTLFDQVLANQFSQLANVDHLFSFRNADNRLEKVEGIEKIIKSDYAKMFLDYPADFIDVSPSYFFQPLYDVPNIRPLLKRNETFDFADELSNAKVREKKSWTKYKDDPYNPYIMALKEYLEEEEVNLDRRNAILDHLLARNGESPYLLDRAIEGSICTGDSRKDRVIYKSLYLQNLGLLSYYRVKSFNYAGAEPILVEVEDAEKEVDKIIKVKRSKNFLFNPSYLFKVSKLRPDDFVNYSAIELKLNLLFGLTTQYLNFIRAKEESVSRKNQLEIDQVYQALWFLYERKGLIMIEPNLVLRLATYRVKVRNEQGEDRILFNRRLTHDELIAVRNELKNFTEENLFNAIQNGKLSIGAASHDIKYLIVSLKPLKGSEKLSVDVTNCKWGEHKRIKTSPDEIKSDANFYFPSYIAQFLDDAFQERIKVFLEECMPVNIRHRLFTPTFEEVQTLIPAFVNFRNTLRENGVNVDPSDKLLKYAKDLAAQILILNKKYPAK